MLRIRAFPIWLFLALAVLASPAWAASTRVSFLLVNDIYLMTDEVHPDGKRRGGFARLAAVVKAERAKGTNVVFAHAGDTLSPSLMSGVDRGAHIVALTNAIAPDVFAPGNHEFDFGKATFLQRMGEARFPLYAANLRGPDGQPLPAFRDRAIVIFDGVRIGLTGITHDETPRTSTPEDLRFLPTVDTAKAQAELLRNEGADFVVVVAHADRTQDIALAASRAADLILSGHDHDLFISFDGQTALVESSSDAHYVTIVDVSIDVTERGGRREVTWWPEFRVVDTATVTPDADVEAMVATYQGDLERDLGATIATTGVELDSRNATVRTREAAIGNLVADAMRDVARADVAIMNGGGIRAGKMYAPGVSLTRRDILTELPFNNRLVTVEMSGRDLRAALENGLSALPNAAGRFPQVSGLTIEADAARPVGSRITAIRVGSEPLDDNRIYKVATNDFLARGGDGYATFRDAKRLLPDADSPLVATETMTYVQRLGTIRSAVEGRITLR